MKNVVESFGKCVRVCGCGLLLLTLVVSPARSANVPLSWTASTDTNVVGYRIFYGGASQNYTNSLWVGNVTNTVINGLNNNTSYYFAAKGYDMAGDSSPFSNEAFITSASVPAAGELIMNTSSLVNTNNEYVYTLGGGTPSGYWINPTTGVLYWTPGVANASTTNYVTVVITDTLNQNTTVIETIMITVGPVVNDFMALSLGRTMARSGASGSLPINVNSSAGATNLNFTVGWPAEQLTNVTLTLNGSNVTGQIFNQGNNLVVQINGATISSGSNTLGQLNFQVPPGQESASLPLPLLAVSSTKADATAYNNISYADSTVTVIGSHPLLAPAVSTSGARHSLTIYGIPQSSYEVQYATNLTSPKVWNTSLAFTQTNLVQNIDLPDNYPTVYYRVLQQ